MSIGLLSYPILMAADILLYKGTHVHVVSIFVLLAFYHKNFNPDFAFKNGFYIVLKRNTNKSSPLVKFVLYVDMVNCDW